MQPQLDEMCGQLEQVFVASLLPQSFFGAGTEGNSGDPDGFPVESSISSALFTQAFAAALERAGGLGLGHEIYRAISGSRV